MMSENNKTIWSIIFENWAQVSVLLFAVGSIFSTWVNWYLKKNEIKFSKLHENRVISIKEFYRCTYKLRLATRAYLYTYLFSKQADAQIQLNRVAIAEATAEFEVNAAILKLFIDAEQFTNIDEIKRICNDVRMDIDMAISGVGNISGVKADNDLLEDSINSKLASIESSLRKYFLVN